MGICWRVLRQKVTFREYFYKMNDSGTNSLKRGSSGLASYLLQWVNVYQLVYMEGQMREGRKKMKTQTEGGSYSKYYNRVWARPQKYFLGAHLQKQSSSFFASLAIDVHKCSRIWHYSFLEGLFLLFIACNRYIQGFRTDRCPSKVSTLT